MGWKRLALNSTWLLAARLLGQALALGTIIMIARDLGQAELGQFSFITSFLFMGNVVTTFGMDTLLIKEVAAGSSTISVRTSTALWLQLSLSAVCVALVLFFPWGRFPIQADTISALKIAHLSLFPLAFYTIFSAVLRGLERMDLYTYASLAIPAAQVFGAALVLTTHSGLTGLVWTIVLSYVLVSGVAFVLCCQAHQGFSTSFRPFYRISKNTLVPAVLAIVRQAWPLALFSILFVAMQRMGVLGLTFFVSDASAGQFAAAFRLVEAAKVLPFALLGTLLPALSRLASSSGKEQEAGRAQQAAQLGLLGYGLLVVAVFLLLGRNLLAGLFGPAYTGAAPVLHLLSVSMLPFAFSATSSVSLVTHGHSTLALKGLFASFLGSAVLILILAPSQGPSGAAAAYLTGEVLLAIYLWKACARVNQLPNSSLPKTRIEVVGEKVPL